MNRMHPQTLLFVLLGAVPVVVAGCGMVAFLLMRAGYGVVVWALLPFLASLLAVAAIAFHLPRAEKRDRGQDRGRDGRGT
jgi:uncharacterized membrane protein